MEPIMKKSGKSDASEVLSRDRTTEIEELTQKIFGTKPDRVAFPGGKHRSAFVADVKGALYVLAKRDNEQDAQFEAIVLNALSPTGYVPEFVAREGRWLVQQCIPGQRLPVLLDGVSGDATRKTMLASALDALVAIRNEAHSVGLQHRMPRLGVTPGWIDDRINEAHVISGLLEIRPPDLDVEKMRKVLTVKHQDFIKWDARPGNALVHEGRMIWFDWEDCGRRFALDDLVCLLFDEWSTVSSTAEAELVENYLDSFRGHMPQEKAFHYLAVAGLVQTGYRLRLAIKYRQRDGDWWDRKKCLMGDKVGVTPQEVGRLCERGLRWSGETEILAPYKDWIHRLCESLEIDFERPKGTQQSAA